MQRKWKLARTLVLVALAASSCTEAQISAWEASTGTRIEATARQALLDAGDPTVVAQSSPLVYVHQNPAVQQWHDLAIQAGWLEEEWPWLSCVINRETGRTGQPDMHNGKGRDDSYGLLQLNMKAHRLWVAPLVEDDFDNLYDPLTNLSIGRFLYEKAGKSPWRGSCSHTHT